MSSGLQCRASSTCRRHRSCGSTCSLPSRRGSGRMVVDLLGVTFIDSTALGVLIGTKERSEQAGIDLRLVMEEPRIIKIFEIQGWRTLSPLLQR